MSAAMIIYLAEVAQNLTVILVITLVIAGLGVAIGGIKFTCDYDKDEKVATLKFVRYAALVIILASIPLVFTPSKSSIYLMAGAKVTEDIVKSPEAKELGGKILKVINQKLDEQVKK